MYTIHKYVHICIYRRPMIFFFFSPYPQISGLLILETPPWKLVESSGHAVPACGGSLQSWCAWAGSIFWTPRGGGRDPDQHFHLAAHFHLATALWALPAVAPEPDRSFPRGWSCPSHAQEAHSCLSACVNRLVSHQARNYKGIFK